MRLVRKEVLEDSLADARAAIDLTDEQIYKFTRTGSISIPNVLPPELFGMMRDRTQGVLDRPLLPVKREVTDPEWHNVRKATLFRHPKTVEEWLHSLYFHSPELLSLAEWSDNVVRYLGGRLLVTERPEAEAAAVLLRGHRSTRAVIHHMLGTPDDIAVIGQHRDVRNQLGANTALAFDRGTELVTGEEVPANTLTVYAGANTSAVLGIEPPLHGFTSSDDRTSVVFTRMP